MYYLLNVCDALSPKLGEHTSKKLKMFALKKRASKGRGRGRLGKKSSSSSSSMFTLQSSAKKKTKAERRILNEFEKGEVRFYRRFSFFFISSVSNRRTYKCILMIR